MYEEKEKIFKNIKRNPTLEEDTSSNVGYYYINEVEINGILVKRN